MVLEFKDDDKAYLDWANSHLEGFVLNLRRKIDSYH